jgi:16S rRNA (cytosine967-C5)-methyltransferase
MGGKKGVKASRSGSRASKARKTTALPQRPTSAQLPQRPLREDLVRALALEAYAAIRDEGRVADRTLDFLLRREKRLYAGERRAVAEAVYGMLRAEGRLDFLLEKGLGGAVLRSLGRPARQALYYEAWRVLDRRIPPKQALADGGLSAALLPGLVACANPAPHLAELEGDPVRRLAVEAALPEWMARLFVTELGEEAAFALARSMNERAPLTLRANRLKTDRDGLLRALRAEGVEARPTS